MQKKSCSYIKKTAEFISVLLMLLVACIVIVFYRDIPSQVPLHYNIYGEADAYSRKWAIFIVPIVMMITYIALSILQKKPHIFNYPIKVTEQNKIKLYEVGVEMVVVFKAMSLLMLSSLSISSILDSINKNGYINAWLIIAIVLLWVIIFIYYIRKMYALK